MSKEHATSDPYGSLDPRVSGSPDARPVEAGVLRAIGRGARKRCPRCGDRRVLESWFRLKALCPRCSLRFEQEEGGFLGAMTLNYMIAFGVWIIVLGLVLAFTVPEVPVEPLIVASVIVLAGVPLWFFPRSKLMWAAIEWLANRTDPDYRPAATRDERARRLE